MRRTLVAGVLGALAAPSGALAHGDRVPRGELASAWRFDLGIVIGAALAAALFAQAFVRLRRRGRTDHAGFGRPLVFALGIGLGLGALLSPLDAVGEEYLLSAHMLQHMLLADVVPALLLVSVRGPLVFFLLPASVLRPLARLRTLRRVLRAVLRAPVALLVWASVFAVWHIPEVYGAALRHGWLHRLEHLIFVLAGVLVWNQLVDPARRGELGIARRVGLAACLLAAGVVLGDVLVFSPAGLYEAYADQDERLLGLSVRLDQQLAGVVMMVEQLLALGTAALLLLLPRLRDGRGDGLRP